MKNINNFNIDTSDLPAVTLPRQYTVDGEKDAEFILQVFDTSDPVKFYDFGTESFSTTFTSTSSLQVKMNSNVYYKNIDFPANASGNTYTAFLFTPDEDTELTFSTGKNSYSTTITQQLADAALTFTPSSGTSAAYGTPPTTTSTVSSTVTSNVAKAISWTLTNSETDANGFGLRLTRQPVDTDWYFQATENNVGGTAADSDQVVVADLTDLTTGMELTYITGTTSPGAATTITAINTTTKTLTLSRDQAITNGHTMTFRAYGSSVIKKAIGVDINFSEFNSETTSTAVGSTSFTKTVRTTVSGDAAARKTIALEDTHGLHGGAHLIFKGLNVVNTGTNTIASINADADGTGDDGTMTVLVSQSTSLLAGTTLHFSSVADGETFGTEITINNTVVIATHPASVRTIYLNLDNFITLGAAS